MKYPAPEDVAQMLSDLTAIGYRLNQALQANEHPYVKQLLVNANYSYKDFLGNLAVISRAVEHLNSPIEYNERLNQIDE